MNPEYRTLSFKIPNSGKYQLTSEVFSVSILCAKYPAIMHIYCNIYWEWSYNLELC